MAMYVICPKHFSDKNVHYEVHVLLFGSFEVGWSFPTFSVSRQYMNML